MDHEEPRRKGPLFNAEERADLAIIREWSEIPCWWERLDGEGDVLPRVRVVRVCPEEWLDTDAGRKKLMRLMDILARDPFSHYVGEGEEPPQPPERLMAQTLTKGV